MVAIGGLAIWTLGAGSKAIRAVVADVANSARGAVIIGRCTTLWTLKAVIARLYMPS